MERNTVLKCDTSVLMHFKEIFRSRLVLIGAAFHFPNAKEWHTESILVAHSDTSEAHSRNEAIHRPVVNGCEGATNGSRLGGHKAVQKPRKVETAHNKTERLVKHHDISNNLLLFVCVGGQGLFVLHSAKTSQDGEAGCPVEELHATVVGLWATQHLLDFGVELCL